MVQGANSDNDNTKYFRTIFMHFNGYLVVCRCIVAGKKETSGFKPYFN